MFAIAVAMMNWRGELQKTLGFSSSITHREVGLSLSGSDEKKLRHQLYRDTLVRNLIRCGADGTCRAGCFVTISILTCPNVPTPRSALKFPYHSASGSVLRAMGIADLLAIS